MRSLSFLTHHEHLVDRLLYSQSDVLVGMAGARQLHGRELSYNNLMDADAAWRTASDFADATVSVVKHANSCGLASRDDIAEAYLQAYEGDTVSAFGGIVAFNRTVTAAAAEAMEPVFYEVVIAPDYEPAAKSGAGASLPLLVISSSVV